jgi:SAM-dependent methyltransferase
MIDKNKIIGDKLKEAKRLIEQAILCMEDDIPVVNEFSLLCNLLNSNDWPQATYAVQIVDEDSESDKDERAEVIVNMFLPKEHGKRFLDFGCGEGHVANYASKSAELSVSYDVVNNPRSRFIWEDKKDKLLLTTDFNKVISEGPYDIILIYDVLDHAQDPKEVLTKAKSVLAEDGKIYVRTHPWTSRHGGHAYRKINKAFVHIVFTEEELRSMGVELEYNVKSMRPIDDFNSWLNGSGLKKSSEPDLNQQQVEPFFRENPIVRKRILDNFGIKEWTEGLPEWQMSQCFWDYVLERGDA